tara:strand:+ start:632 stop:1414 length:783 start_codon:yes stop_codon:yes gene_type:complete
MAFTNTPFVDGNAITEADLKGRIENFETYLNGGVSSADLSHGMWVKKEHILRPEFRGGSDDRAEFCTGTARYRIHGPDSAGCEVFHAEARGGGGRSGSENWEPVNGLNVTIKAYRPMTVIYMASWWAWETGSNYSNQNNSASGVLYGESINNASNVCAHFGLFSQKNDGSSLTYHNQTRRSLYPSPNIATDQVNTDISGYIQSTAKQMSIHHVFDLTAGIWNVGIRCHAQDQGSSAGDHSQNIFIRSRSCVVDAHFNSAT